MSPKKGIQVEILSAVNEIGNDRTRSQVIAALEKRFTYLQPGQAALRYEQAMQAIGLAEALAEASEGTRMRHITGLVEMVGESRFVKVEVESNVKPGFEQQAQGLTNYITIHVPYTGETSVEELEEMIADAAEEAAGVYAGAFFEGVSATRIIGVF